MRDQILKMVGDAAESPYTMRERKHAVMLGFLEAAAEAGMGPDDIEAALSGRERKSAGDGAMAAISSGVLIGALLGAGLGSVTGRFHHKINRRLNREDDPDNRSLTSRIKMMGSLNRELSSDVSSTGKMV